MKTKKKKPGTTRKKDAANRHVNATRHAKSSSDGKGHGDKLQATISRLRESKEKCEQADYQCGFNLGKQWAEGSAEASELKHLEALQDHVDAEHEANWGDYFQVFGNRCKSDEDLFFALHFDDDQAVKDHLRGVVFQLLRRAVSPEMLLKGFAEGALEIWMSVKGEL